MSRHQRTWRPEPVPDDAWQATYPTSRAINRASQDSAAGGPNRRLLTTETGHRVRARIRLTRKAATDRPDHHAVDSIRHRVALGQTETLPECGHLIWPIWTGFYMNFGHGVGSWAAAAGGVVCRHEWWPHLRRDPYVAVVGGGVGRVRSRVELFEAIRRDRRELGCRSGRWRRVGQATTEHARSGMAGGGRQLSHADSSLARSA